MSHVTLSKAPAASPLAAAALPVRSTRVIVLGCLAALLLGAVGVVAVQSALVEAGWLDASAWWTRMVSGTGPIEPADAFVPLGFLAVLLGLWLVWSALRPGRRQGIHVGSATGTWMTRRDVAKFASAAAEEVDGVLSASTSVARRSVTVTVRTTGPDLEDPVRASVSDRISVLDPSPRIVVRQRSVTS